MWVDIVKHKYIYPLSLLEWIRKPSKTKRNISSFWREAINAFDAIGDCLQWKIGRGDKVGVGIDP